MNAFSKRDWLLIAVFILSFSTATFIKNYLGNSQWVNIAVVLSMGLINFTTAIILFRDVLQTHWLAFKALSFKKWFYIIGAVISVYALLIITRQTLIPLLEQFAPDHRTSQAIDQHQDASFNLPLVIVAAVIPLMAAVTEEILFRHVLFMGRLKNNSYLALIVWIFISSLAFGLIHWNNFGGYWVATVPYMLIGALFALVYYVSKNIWFALLTHFTFNFIQSVLIPFMGLALLQLTT